MVKWILISALISAICAAKTIKVFEIDTGVQRNSHKEIDNYLPKNIANILDYFDTNGHGTHVAGLILKDVCPEVELDSCSWFDISNPNGSFPEYLNCLDIATIEKPDIINISSGGPNFDQKEFDLLKKLSNGGTIIVVAAGNNAKNLLFIGNDYYPAKYDIKNIIPVGNLNPDGTREFLSNYGLLNEVWEYGVDVNSTLPNGTYGKKTGTSMAAAIRSNRILRTLCQKKQGT